jgi:hypothetical protein
MNKIERQTLTAKIASAKYLEGDNIEFQLEELARGYLHYLTWERKYNGELFHQIVEEDYNGNMDAAIRGFLYKVFRKVQMGNMGNLLQWVVEKGILLLPEESSWLLFKIKQIYMTHTYEEVKELVGLGDFVLK